MGACAWLVGKAPANAMADKACKTRRRFFMKFLQMQCDIAMKELCFFKAKKGTIE
jgi:hypothetical protein